MLLFTVRPSMYLMTEKYDMRIKVARHRQVNIMDKPGGCSILNKTSKCKQCRHKASVPDPDPKDSSLFVTPGYGSGSLNLQAQKLWGNNTFF